MAFRRQWLLANLAAAAALFVVGCGGTADSPIASRVVVFGDSLSDMGTYTPATSLAGNGTAPYFGGKFTTNTHTGYTAASNSSTANTWAEWIAARLGVAVTPYEVGFGPQSVTCPAAANPALANSCTGYAQGGSRVTNPAGVNNPNGTGLIGTSPTFFTRPMTTQVANHLAKFGGFKSGDIVFVWGGHNDAFIQFGAVAAATITPAAAVANMQQAGTELANLVKDQILAKGATRVAVLTLADISVTPGYSGLPAANKALLTQLTAEFDNTLLSGLAGSAAQIIDARALISDFAGNPSKYGFTNATTAACDPAKISVITGGRDTSGSSLFCNATAGAAFNGLKTGASTSTWAFADSVHPSTGGHKVLADQFWAKLQGFGWVPANL
jgi:phospholipase/lecithinase/hemolysin